MSTERELAEWLRTRSSDQLDPLMSRIGLPTSGTSPSTLARLLLQHHVTSALIGYCTLPETQALSAARS